MAMLDAIGPYEILRNIKGVNIKFVSKEKGEITADSHFVHINSKFCIDEISKDDILLIPGSAIAFVIAMRDKNLELDFEATLNNLAYTFLTKKNIDYAIKIFELNIQEHPNSANAFDSFAEGYFINNQFELSKINYQKSLELNPKNTNAEEMIN